VPALDFREPRARWPGLTQMQTVVAEGICRGLSRSQIAADLAISVKTFDSHRGQILSRLHLVNEVQLLRAALRLGWLSLDAADEPEPDGREGEGG